MEKRRFLWVKVTWWVAKVLLLITLPAWAYYQWWLLPAQELPDMLTKAEPVVIEHYFNMLENRLAWQELVRLDPQHGDYAREREGLLVTIRNSITKGLALTEAEVSLPGRDSIVFGEVREVYSDVFEPFRVARERHQAVLREQQELMSDIDAFVEATGQLATYQAGYDLGRFDLESDLENVIGRLEIAQLGLRDVMVEVDRLPAKTNETSELRASILKVVSLLDALGSVDAQGDREAAIQSLESIRAQYIELFADVKEALHAAELSYLHGPDRLDLFTSSANVVQDYEYLNKNVDWWQGVEWRKRGVVAGVADDAR